MVQQDVQDGAVAVLRRRVKRALAVHVDDIDQGSVLEQHLDGVRVVVAGSTVQGRPSHPVGDGGQVVARGE